MHIIITHLNNYIHDEVEYTDSVRSITWWVLLNENARPFTEEEKNLFMAYISSTENFAGGVKSYTISEDDLEFAPTINDLFINENYPYTIILRADSKNLLRKNQNVWDIELQPLHNYDLPFDVIGKFEMFET